MLTIMSIFLLDKVHCAQLIVSLFPLSGQGGAGSLATQKSEIRLGSTSEAPIWSASPSRPCQYGWHPELAEA